MCHRNKENHLRKKEGIWRRNDKKLSFRLDVKDG